MKILYTFIPIWLFLISKNVTAQAPLNFTLSSSSNSFVITCANPALTVLATANTTNTIQCTWFSAPTASIIGNPITYAAAGTYTVFVKDVVTNSVVSQQFSITQNTTSPSSVVSPSSKTVNCTSPMITFTANAVSPTTNIAHYWYSPFAQYPVGPVTFTSGGITSVFNAISGSGVYTHVLTDLTNGCSAVSTVTAINTSTNAFAFFNPSSTSFSLGCFAMNTATFCCMNVVSTNNSAVQCAFMPPGSNTAIPLPALNFVGTTCTLVNVPGTWVMVVYDPASNCQSALAVPFISNTVAPSVGINISTQTLTCNSPTILANAFSPNPFTQISWNVPATPTTISSPTISVGPATGPPTSTANLSYATYTAVATFTANSCNTTSVISIYQNFVSPPAGSNTYTISCMGTNTNVTIAPGFTGSPSAYSFSWTAPGSGGNFIGATNTLSATVNGPGSYSCSVINTSTGCSKIVTVTVSNCVGLKENYLGDLQIRVYPNPSSGLLNIEFAEMPLNIKLELLNVTGELILTKYITMKSNKILLDLPRGFYFYRIVNDNLTIKSGKLLIE